ncbi:TPA: hypothetical protein ACSTJ0_001649 [Serratia fonticola]
MELSIRYSFYPVGQGIFSSGTIGSPYWNGNFFSWVYDCGAVKENIKTLQLEISRLRNNLFLRGQNYRPSLNVVFISHFDMDHISGLVELLNHFDVDTLVLPYVPLLQRIVFTITSKNFHNSNFQHFMTNPISFIDSIEGCKVRKVILVPPSTKSDSDDSDDTFYDLVQPLLDIPALEADRLQNLDEGHEILLSARHSNVSISSLQPGGRLLFGRLWEFVPYNELSLKVKATPHFRLAANRVGTALIQTNDPVLRAKILGRLKSIYDRTFGGKPKDKNEISLFLYSGPLGRITTYMKKGSDIFSATLTSSPCLSGHCHICTTSFGYANNTCSILFTGDGYLSSKPRINKLRDFFGVRRLASLDIFQVMHHGSKINWRKGLAAEFSPNESVFCADPNYKYKHPNKTVWKDFSSYGRVLVNDKGISRFYRVKF